MIRFASHTDEKNMRDLVIQYANDHGLCKDGVNEFLADAGMSPWETYQKVEIRVVCIIHEDDVNAAESEIRDAIEGIDIDHIDNSIVSSYSSVIEYEVEL